MNYTHPIFDTDSYKTSHWKQYPPGTTRVHSYVEARKRTANPADDFTVFFGLQAILKKLLTEKMLTFATIDRAAEMAQQHGVPFNTEGWSQLRAKYGSWDLPIEIKAVPEGSIVPNGNALMTVENTDTNFPWLTSWLETALLRVWYPTTVATKSYKIRQVIMDALLRTADNLDGLPFKLHDFGARGVSSHESAELGGLAHLVNFLGTDTIAALYGATKYYGAVGAVGFSIPAAEHSTITSWGKGQGEVDAYRNMLDQYAKPGAILAVVSDSYDIYNATEHIWGGVLKDQVINSGATLVVRPDSGDPNLVLPELARILDAKFGSTVNSKGYKVLNNVRLIQGDGIDSPGTVATILKFLEVAGFSADNIAFGMGGGLLQHVNRDTYGFAMKCSAIEINGEWRDVYKEPITDPGKVSKRGRQMLYLDGDVVYRTGNVNEPWADKKTEALQTVYRNGRFQNLVSFDEVRARVAAGRTPR